jgi:hypothetical protein
MAAAMRKAGGFSALAVLVFIMVLAIGSASVRIALERARQDRCARNLRRIYSWLEMYEIDRGTLPHLAMFPDEPRHDHDSLVTVLQAYGSGDDTFLCPAEPADLRQEGLTYLWNVQLNGKTLRSPKEPTWMLVEINALSQTVPAPHFGAYNILYTDGQVRREREPPLALREP